MVRLSFGVTNVLESLFSDFFLTISLMVHVNESLGLTLVVLLNFWQKSLWELTASTMVILGPWISLSLTASEQRPHTHLSE